MSVEFLQFFPNMLLLLEAYIVARLFSGFALAASVSQASELACRDL